MRRSTRAGTRWRRRGTHNEALKREQTVSISPVVTDMRMPVHTSPSEVASRISAGVGGGAPDATSTHLRRSEEGGAASDDGTPGGAG